MDALADTSVFIAPEVARPMNVIAIPQNLAVSAITLGELRAGVLAAEDVVTRARRLRTLGAAEALRPLPVDREVAAAWAELRVALLAAGRRLPVNDSWIAATAIAHGLPVVTQDADYAGVPGLRVIQV